MVRFRSCLLAPLFLFALSTLAQGQDANDGYTCGADGFWRDPQGKKTKFGGCEGGAAAVKDADCTTTAMTSEVSKHRVRNLRRTCISHNSSSNGRCWWTHVPSGVLTATDGRKVPLLVDMHSGGGCASSEVADSGFLALSETEAAKPGGGMVVVFPQGGFDRTVGGLWASGGSESRTAKGEAAKKEKKLGSMAQWDDISFLEQLIANMVKSSPHKDIIDARRIYMTGFSNGCMMAHRFSMERSRIVAAFGCHGGELNLVDTVEPSEMKAMKSTHNIQAMPAYLTIGDKDPLVHKAKLDWRTWSYWNGCSSQGNYAKEGSTGVLVENIACSCATYKPELKTVLLEIKGGLHAADPSTAAFIWNFVSQYKRDGVLGELPTATRHIVPKVLSTPTIRPTLKPPRQDMLVSSAAMTMVAGLHAALAAGVFHFGAAL